MVVVVICGPLIHLGLGRRDGGWFMVDESTYPHISLGVISLGLSSLTFFLTIL